MNNRNPLIIDEKNIIPYLQKFIQINTENPPGNEKAGALFLAEKQTNQAINQKGQFNKIKFAKIF